nr:peptide deformylase [Salsipaludibacter albus]
MVHVGDPVLRAGTREVTRDELASSEVQRLIDDLVATMRDADGAGIAAPQVGSDLRIAIAEVSPETANRRYPYKPPIPLTVLVNPRLRPVGEETVAINEGCLSVPGLRGVLERHVTVEVTWWDRDGIEHVEERRGLTAGTFQHEVDHLDGRVFLDRVTDPTTFTTWDNYERHHRASFEERIGAFVARVGS